MNKNVIIGTLVVVGAVYWCSPSAARAASLDASCTSNVWSATDVKNPTGQPFQATTGFTNSGTKYWQRDSVTVGLSADAEERFWHSKGGLLVSDIITPVQTYQLFVRLTAPQRAGKYPIRLQMKDKTEGRFGDICEGTITVIDLPGTIAHADVPRIVGNVFQSVFHRPITPAESTYWKNRARTDKRTEVSLSGAMSWSKARGVSLPKK